MVFQEWQELCRKAPISIPTEIQNKVWRLLAWRTGALQIFKFEMKIIVLEKFVRILVETNVWVCCFSRVQKFQFFFVKLSLLSLNRWSYVKLNWVEIMNYHHWWWINFSPVLWSSIIIIPFPTFLVMCFQHHCTISILTNFDYSKALSFYITNWWILL